MDNLATIKARGGKVMLMMAGSQKYYKNADGTFSLSKWKARVDRYRKVNFSQYINDGTIIGHYLIDEPYDPANWAGRPISGATLEEMAKYSKAIWPSLKTIVRAEPYLIKWSGTYRALDAAWAQYLWRKGDVKTYLNRNLDALDVLRVRSGRSSITTGPLLVSMTSVFSGSLYSAIGASYSNDFETCGSLHVNLQHHVGIRNGSRTRLAALDRIDVLHAFGHFHQWYIGREDRRSRCC